MTDACILQFGTSRFLQAHVDLFAHEAAQSGQDVPGIVVVQTTGDPTRATRLRRFSDPAGYPVRIRGLDDGAVVDRVVQVKSVVDGMQAAADWPKIARLFETGVSHVVTNTGDTGYAVADADRDPALLQRDGAPESFPAMLLVLLHRRWVAGGAPVMLLPCELVRHNGDALRETIIGLAKAIGAPDAFIGWLATGCVWANTLVDRIVSEPIDPVGAVAEPYALWAIERDSSLVLPFDHPAIALTDDLDGYERLKLYILNLGHSWLAERWHRQGGDADMTVRAMLAAPETGAALRDMLEQEVAAGFAAHGHGAAARAYIERTLERFANPFLDHRIADIHGNHALKIDKRIAGFIRWVESADDPPPLPRLRAIADANAFDGAPA